MYKSVLVPVCPRPQYEAVPVSWRESLCGQWSVVACHPARCPQPDWIQCWGANTTAQLRPSFHHSWNLSVATKSNQLVYLSQIVIANIIADRIFKSQSYYKCDTKIGLYYRQPLGFIDTPDRIQKCWYYSLLFTDRTQLSCLYYRQDTQSYYLSITNITLKDVSITYSYQYNRHDTCVGTAERIFKVLVIIQIQNKMLKQTTIFTVVCVLITRVHYCVLVCLTTSQNASLEWAWVTHTQGHTQTWKCAFTTHVCMHPKDGTKFDLY